MKQKYCTLKYNGKKIKKDLVFYNKILGKSFLKVFKTHLSKNIWNTKKVFE